MIQTDTITIFNSDVEDQIVGTWHLKELNGRDLDYWYNLWNEVPFAINLTFTDGGLCYMNFYNNETKVWSTTSIAKWSIPEEDNILFCLDDECSLYDVRISDFGTKLTWYDHTTDFTWVFRKG